MGLLDFWSVCLSVSALSGADLEFDLDFSIAMTTSLPLLSRARRPSAAIEEKDVSVSDELFIDFRFIRFYFSLKINEMR